MTAPDSAPDYTHAHDAAVEQAVLAAVLAGGADAYAVLADRCPHVDAFYTRNHQVIAWAIHDLGLSGQRIDTLAVTSHLARCAFAEVMLRLQPRDRQPAQWAAGEALGEDRWGDSALAQIGGFNAVSDLAAVFAPQVSLPAQCDLLARYRRQRQGIAALQRAVAALQAPQGSRRLETIASAACTDLLAQLAGEAGRQGATTADGGVAEALAEHDRAQSGDRRRVGTWGDLPSANASLPLRPGRFLVLAGPPKGGKTSLALEALEATADRLGADSVAMVSGEMSALDLGQVLIGRHLHVPGSLVEDGRLSRGQRERAAAYQARLAAQRIGLYHGQTVTTPAVVAWARRQHALSGGRLHLLVVDHLHLFTGHRAKQLDYEIYSEATRALKALSLELGLCVLLLCQLSREGRKAARGKDGSLLAYPEPQVSDLRGSGTIEQDTDGVLFLWAPVLQAGTQLTEAKIEANRRGPNTRWQMEFRKASGQRFAELLPAAAACPDTRPRFERLTDKPGDPADEDCF